MEPKMQVKFMTYNVWSRDDKRMQAIGRLVEEHQPHVIFLQETTGYIRYIRESFAWRKNYQPFRPVIPTDNQNLMLSKIWLDNCKRWGIRNNLQANTHPGMKSIKPICMMTTQLEPVHCFERYKQAQEAIAALSGAENVVFGGDMSWDDNIDLPFPLPYGWVDAWTELRGQDRQVWLYGGIQNEGTGGWTYDAVANPMLGGCKPERKRSDRFLCKLKDYTLESIEMIGTEVIPGVMSFTGDDGVARPVLPSHRFGLLLTISPKQDD